MGRRLPLRLPQPRAPLGRNAGLGIARAEALGDVELVGANGPGQVTIDAIAEVADVAKQTIYRWSPSRTAVILDALVRGTMKATLFGETDDLKADFERHLQSVIRLFNSPTGSIIR